MLTIKHTSICIKHAYIVADTSAFANESTMMALMNEQCPSIYKVCNITAGVIFHGLPKGGKTLPKKISYTIRSGCPSMGVMRNVDKQFPDDIIRGPRSYEKNGE